VDKSLWFDHQKLSGDTEVEIVLQFHVLYFHAVRLGAGMFSVRPACQVLGGLSSRRRTGADGSAAGVAVLTGAVVAAVSVVTGRQRAARCTGRRRTLVYVYTHTHTHTDKWGHDERLVRTRRESTLHSGDALDSVETPSTQSRRRSATHMFTSTARRLVAWHNGRTSVFSPADFTVLRSTCSWWVTTYVGKSSAIGQPTRPTQPFIPSGLINK